MGIHVCQSQCLDILLQALLKQIGQPKISPLSVLATQHFIVPNKAVEQWLTQSIAQKKGISANKVFHQRIQSFQWYIYQQVLTDKDQVRQANIPRLVMKWRIFEALKPFIQPEKISLISTHPLHGIIERIYDSASHLQAGIDKQLKKQSMLYWVAEQVSRLFSHYMQYRGHCLQGHGENCTCSQNWLAAWGKDKALNVEQLISDQNVSLYDLDQAKDLEAWQRWLWQHIFHDDFQNIRKIDESFWQVLQHAPNKQNIIASLPQQLVVFTLLDLPPSQLQFLRRLGQYIDVVIYHYNPSQEYWADSVDPNWKKRYDLSVKERFIEKNKQRGKIVTDTDINKFFEGFNHRFNAQSRESRHPLLTRFGKQARDHFSLLAGLSSGEEGEWFDLFLDDFPDNLLGKVQSDILYLMEPEEHQYQLKNDDDSIQIHVCHSSIRQLEVLKDQLLHWLSQGTLEHPRKLDDILVLTPNLTALEPYIRSVFVPPPRQQGECLESYVPIKIGGVAQLDITNAWRSVIGRIELPQGRFGFDAFADWLTLLTTQNYYQIDAAAVARILALLQDAGFKRGLDEQHLQRFLSEDDQDFRFTFKFALDRLSLGIAIPEHQIFDTQLSYDRVRPEDFALIATLIQIYHDLDHRRDWLIAHEQGKQKSVEAWLKILQQELFDFMQKGETNLKVVADIIQKHIRMLTLSIYTDKHRDDAHVPLDDLNLPLPYVLAEIQQGIDSQLENAEPSGQVTFSQIGSIRPLPYKLVVLLNLDSGTFPSRHTHVPFDLMQVLRPHLGDRSRLEDDQGAFLDALLLAKENLWLFYNGFDVNDGQVRQPSSVVQKFVDHLKLIVATDHPDDDLVEIEGIEIPTQLTSLYCIHPLQPFDFKNQTLRYQDQWFTVAQQIQQAKGKRQPWTLDQYLNTSNELKVINSQQWLGDMTFPAQLYLKTLGVQNLKPQDVPQEQEPLLLDGLGRYAVRDFIQNQEVVSEDLLLDQLPIGKTKHSAWQSTQSEYEDLNEKLHQYAPKPTETTQHTWQVNEQLFMQFQVPQNKTTDWVSLNASSARGERRTKVWLEYLLWLSHLGLGNEGQNYRRIVVFSDQTVICEGLSSDQSKTYLNHWLEAWQYAQTTLLVLPADLVFKTDSKTKKLKFWKAVDEFDIEAAIKAWKNSSTFSNFSVQDDKASQYHRDWQFLLQHQDATLLLKQACEKFVLPLYTPIVTHQTAEKH